jgi:hypothetical protein
MKIKNKETHTHSKHGHTIVYGSLCFINGDPKVLDTSEVGWSSMELKANCAQVLAVYNIGITKLPTMFFD